MPDLPERRITGGAQRHDDDGPEEFLDHQPMSIVDHLRRPWVLASAVIVTLGVGFTLGFRVSAANSRSRQPLATQTVTRVITAPPPGPSSPLFNQIIGTGSRCSMQTGSHRLQLGIEIRNGLDQPVTLVSLHVPSRSGDQLRPVSTGRGACGQLAGADDTVDGYHFVAGATVWLTATVAVLTDCPTPLHLTMQLDYTQAGRPATTSIDGFPDLGGVPYSGCHR